jgi:TonB family protein
MKFRAGVWMLLVVCASAQMPEAKPDGTPLRITQGVHVTKMVDTPYPIRAEQEQIQGRVVLDVTVAADGKVKSTEVISGNQILASAFQDAVKKWKFEPQKVNGQAVPFITRVGMNFALYGKVLKDETPPVTAAPQQNPSPDPDSNAPDRVRVSSGVAHGNLIYKVQPVYPKAAVANHVQGAVILHAIIGRDGIMKLVEVVSGPPELVEAAKGAVEQWRYRPYLLNGSPVEVDTKIQVNFNLSDTGPPILR